MMGCDGFRYKLTHIEFRTYVRTENRRTGQDDV